MKLRSVFLTVMGTVVLMAGCGGHDSPSGTAGNSAANAQKAVYLRIAQCLRSHGQPAFPDPVQDDKGNWGFPASAGKPISPAACEALFRQARSVNESLASQAPISAAGMARLRDFARCMRQHGLPDFPDPNQGGRFELPARYALPNGEQLIKGPERDCPGASPTIVFPR